MIDRRWLGWSLEDIIHFPDEYVTAVREARHVWPEPKHRYWPGYLEHEPEMYRDGFTPGHRRGWVQRIRNGMKVMTWETGR